MPRNYSNIDILAYDPNAQKYYDIEVKYRSAYTISANNRNGDKVSNRSVLPYVEQFTKYKTRDETLKKYTFDKKAIKLLVTTKRMFGKSDRKRKLIESAFRNALKKKKHNRSKVWYFDEIIPELYDKTSQEGRYNTELLQTLRMIKVYVKSKPSN